MINLPGFKILKQIYKSRNSTIYRAIQMSGNRPVVVKLLDKETPSTAEIARFRREFEITVKLSGEGIIKAYGLEKSGDTLAIIIEDFGGESLTQLVPVVKPDIIQKISLAVNMADALSQVHSQEIIHKDVNPSNFILNPDTGKIKIIDFGISSELSRENPELSNPNVLEGTLNYISPEQTGRMNRALDYRTDMYSLGAALYELFTGKLPFYADDALEIVHGHLAKNPKSPVELNHEIPEMLSDIIMKLLSKTAESRYQGMHSLKRDMEYCYEEIKSTGKITYFQIGKNDISNRFQIPQKLYGREREVDELLAAFNRISSYDKSSQSAGVELMLVAGYSGIGKSALVHEVNKPITEKRGNFISGKFDQYKRNIPYTALIQAFQELAKSLLAEKDEKLLWWREKLLNTLGTSGQVVIDVIPEVELIIGKQPPVEKLDPEQSRNRFNIVFQNFVRVFASKDSPLVIFIDDLQWADLPSLHLIEQFMLDIGTENMLIIGAYRENEVDTGHPLPLMINELKKAGCAVNTITLKSLEINDVNQLLSDTLLCDRNKTQPLADLCVNKTLGNPFFLNQLLYYLYEKRNIDFDIVKGVWHYDLAAIRKAEITDNVVELMADKIEMLTEETRNVLKLAACIGNVFDLDTLALVYGKSKNETAGDLFEALKENLAVPADDAYKFISETNQNIDVHYRFLHDRIQQAAYSMIADEEKDGVHLKIGRLLDRSVSPEARDDKIFSIVNHLNRGINLITDQSEKDRLAELNLNAGQKAKNSAAYSSAFEYLKQGIEISGESGWKSNYRLMLTLHEEAQEAAYLCTDYEESERLFEIIITNAKTVLDKVKGYETRIITLSSKGKFLDAVKLGLNVLELLGFKYPKNLKKRHILIEYIKTRLALIGFSDERIISMQDIHDINLLSALRIMQKIGTFALISNPDLFPLNILKRIGFYLKHGNDPLTSLTSYAAFGAILCSFGKIDQGYRFGKLVENMYAKGLQKYKIKTSVILNYFIKSWKIHNRELLDPLLSGYQSKQETGDIEYACFSIFFYCMTGYLVGRNLNDVYEETVNYIHSVTALKQKMHSDALLTLKQVIVSLKNNDTILNITNSWNFFETKFVCILKEENNYTVLCGFYSFKLNLHYYFLQYDDASEYSSKAMQFLNALNVSPFFPFFHFFESLTLLALYPATDRKQKRIHLKKVRQNLKKFKNWAHHAPMNHLHKYNLIKAELANVQGKDSQAMDLYEKAIAGARENEYIQEEALAYERAAYFYLSRGFKDTASAYLTKARELYAEWGAMAKVRHLEDTFPELLYRGAARTKPDISIYEKIKTDETIHPDFDDKITVSSDTAMSDTLDLSTILKASQALAGEIDLSSLIRTIIKISMENAGAARAVLILKNENRMYIEAEATADGIIESGNESASAAETFPVEEGNIPLSIINYVNKTCKSLVLNDASGGDMFRDDPYIITGSSKSILCTPIMDKGVLTGILYLENNLASGVFTPDRIKLLEILSSQAAISIENARLYSGMEEKVNKRTSELNIANSRLQELDRLKTSFFSNVSHELRTPLTLVLSPLEEIRSGTYGESISSESGVIDSMYRNGLRLLKLINNLLDFTRIEAGRMTLYKQRTDIGKLLNYFTANVKSAAESRELTIEFTNKTEGIYPLIDRNLIENAVYNLISNALKFTPEGGSISVQLTDSPLAEPAEAIRHEDTHCTRALRQAQGAETISSLAEPVEAKSYEESHCTRALRQVQGTETISSLAEPVEAKSHFTISVRDTGIGIPADKLDVIFDRFSQIDSSASRKYDGTGIGLSLTKEIVEMHGGRISVESEPGRGSVFTMTIPYDSYTPEESEISKNILENKQMEVSRLWGGLTQIVKHNETEQTEETVCITPDEKIKILITEDNPDMLDFLKSLLEKNYHVDIAGNGREALSLLNSMEVLPDLILTDVMMPEMDGYELTKQIRNDLRFESIPIILLTAKADDSMKLEGFEQGATDYIVKPFNARELTARIEAQLHMKMLRDRLQRAKEKLYEDLKTAQMNTATPKNELPVSEESEEKVLRVIEFIKNNFTSDISREGIAAAIGISADYLSRVFNKVTGKRIDEYINELRIEEAKIRLRENDRTITSIAFDVGFDNIRTFNKTFAAITGMTPSEWRALR